MMGFMVGHVNEDFSSGLEEAGGHTCRGIQICFTRAFEVALQIEQASFQGCTTDFDTG